MGPTDFPLREAHPLRFSSQLPRISLLFLTMMWTSAAASLAETLPGGDQFVTIQQNFTGSSFSDSGFIPPDTMGAVGTTTFVELINGRYSVYDKSAGTVLQSSNLFQFWANAGVVINGSSPYDPRVLYDPSSTRWYAAAADSPCFPSCANNFLLAVSKTSDPTQGWTGFKISSDSTKQHFVDFPTLGFNRDGVYVSANMFPITTGVITNTILAVPKADLLAPTPTVAHATLFENNSLGNTGFALQPAVNLDNGKSAILLSGAFSTNFQRSDIIGDIRSPTLSTGTVIPVMNFPFPGLAVQPGGKLPLDTNGFLVSNVVVQNNALWGVQTVSNNGHDALRWFQIDVASSKVLQEGLIAKTGFDFIYGSIAVNKIGDVVIGFTGSSTSQFASAYATAGTTVNGKTVFGDPLLLRQGVASYERTGLGDSRNRWGDYSATTVDPSNSNSFWTIQERASGLNTWSTQITEIGFGVVSAPEPATLFLFISGFAGLAWMQRKSLLRTDESEEKQQDDVLESSDE